MAEIIVTLLNTKRTRQTVDKLDNTVIAESGGYTVVEGESNSTKIKVNYPEEYNEYSKTVYMTNAYGERDVYVFGVGEDEFLLGDTMTVSGNTTLVFSAKKDETVVYWLPVIVPVAETGINYKKPIVATEDFVKQALAEAQEAVQLCAEVKAQADAGEFKGDKGDKGDVGATGPIPTFKVEKGTHFDEYGNISVETVQSDDVVTLIFDYLRGKTGDVNMTLNGSKLANIDLSLDGTTLTITAEIKS